MADQASPIPPQFLQLKNRGLFTMPNAFSEAPPGSLLVGENVVVSYDGLLSGRRGQKQYGDMLVGTNFEVFQIFPYKGTSLIWYGNALPASSVDPTRFQMAYDSDLLGTWTQTTSAFPGPSYSLTDTYRTAQSNGNIYFTSLSGILKTDAPENALYSAGGLPGLDGTAALVDSSGFLATDSAVAYRMTWTYTDANNNAVEGTPSTRVVITNSTGGSRNVTLVFTIPREATTSYTYNIYRSLQAATAATEPSDELQLVISGQPTSGEITARYFTVTDSTPESSLGAALYTNSGQEGIAQANNIPPVASDMCFFNGYMVYGSVTTQQTFLLSLLSAETPDGIQSGDTFTVTRGVSTFTLTAASSENAAAGQFKVFTGGDPGSDILSTKQSLIHVLNLYPSNTFVYAYDSAANGAASTLPGDFYIQEQGVGGGSFGVASSRSTCWNPALTADPDDNQSLSGGGIGSGLCSKYLQPEAVPVVNTIACGNPNFEWLRCLPLRNSIIVLKQDGLFQLTGATFPFTVTTLDTGTILTAPESPAVMNNQVYAYTNQGVVAISETGPGIISRPIENQLQVISSYLYPDFPRVTFGTAYETDRKYILTTVSETEQFTKGTICYVYDTITEAWTNYVYPVAIWDAVESPVDHRLYITSASTTYPYVFRERKTFTDVDFADLEFPTTVVSYSGTTVEVSSTSRAQVGWSLAQLAIESGSDAASIVHISVIEEIVDATHLIVRDTVFWDLSVDAFSAYEQPIAIQVDYAPITCGNPGIVKFFQEVQFIFQAISFDFITFHFSSDFIASTAPVPLVPKDFSSGWGTFAWGEVPWGGGTFLAQSMRTYIPLIAKRAHWLNVEISLTQAMTQFTYAGLILTYRDTTLRSK